MSYEHGAAPDVAMSLTVDIIQRRLTTETGFTVSIARQVDSGSAVMLAGKGGLERFDDGDRVRVTGHHEVSDRYGKRFIVCAAVKASGPSPAGLQKYLEQLGMPGVGPMRAAAIVRQFGTRTIDALLNRDAAAAAILGARAEEAFDVVRADASRAEFNALMASAGVGPKTRMAIWKAYADDTPYVLAGDPYRLVREVPGFSFALADALADTVGASVNEERSDAGRARAGIEEVLHRLAKAEGHTGATVELLVRETSRLLKVAPPGILDAIRACVAAGDLYEGAWRGQPLIQTRAMQDVEQELATAVAAKLRQPVRTGDIDAAIAHGEAATGFTLDASQRKAAVLGLTQPICLIDGPPGTGKSTVVAVIIAAERYLAPHAAIELCAPVGKAAERIEEITGNPASTVHRLLEALDGSFRRCARNPLTCRLLVVDEVSLLDAYLAARLADAWGRARVILQGDANQLASVGPGRVFADLIASKAIPHARLSVAHRNGAVADIPLAVERITRGERPAERDAGKSAFVTRFQKGDRATATEAVRLAVEALPRHLGMQEPVIILTPAYAGPAGITALNMAVQARLFTDRERETVKIADGMSAGVGDRVIITENCPKRKVFNGHSGQVIAVKSAGVPIISIRLKDGRTVDYAGQETARIALFYAISAHRAQGSEWKAAISVVTMRHAVLLSREWLGTAVSRAKQLAVLVGQRRARDFALSRSELAGRMTGLIAKLGPDPLAHLPKRTGTACEGPSTATGGRRAPRTTKPAPEPATKVRRVIDERCSLPV